MRSLKRRASIAVITDAEVALAQAAAEWLGLSPDSQRARLAGAVLATAGRLALEQPFSAGRKRDANKVLAECLELLGPTLFEEPASERGPVRRSPPRRSRQARR
jgi:hypothetical protein